MSDEKRSSEAAQKEKVSRRGRLTPMVAGTLAISILLAGCVTNMTGNATRVIEDKPIKITETGLRSMSMVSASSGSPFVLDWLDADHFVINVLQENANAIHQNAERTVRVDTRTGKSQQVIESGWILRCFNPVRRIGVIHPVFGRNDQQYRFVALNKQGEFEPIERTEDMDAYCWSVSGEPPQVSGVTQRLREGNGYLVQYRWKFGEMPNEPPNQKPEWFRPGQPPLTLPMWSNEIDKGPILFLDYAQKFLLHSRDSQGKAATDGSVDSAYWKRPYDLSPYRLLALDGTVEVIPYPKIIFEYGLKGFDTLIPTLKGVLLTAHGSIFLLNGEQLTRIWGTSRMPLSGSLPSAYGPKLSPDGCKVVFGRTIDLPPRSAMPISIIDLCKEK